MQTNTPNQELVDAIAKGVRKAQDEESAEQARAWCLLVLIFGPILLLFLTFPWNIALVVMMFQGNPLLTSLICVFAIWCYIKMLSAVLPHEPQQAKTLRDAPLAPTPTINEEDLPETVRKLKLPPPAPRRRARFSY